MPDAAFRIRPMRLDDLDAVLAIERKVFRDPWSRQSYEYELTSNRFSMNRVLEIDGAVAGYSVVWRIYEEFHIANIAIDPARQGQGLGGRLLAALLEERGECRYALLEVRRANVPALRLYERFRFYQSGVRYGYYRDGEDALLMRLDF